MTTEFLHIVIDLSLRQVTAPDGEPILISQIDANVPIVLFNQPPDKGEGKNYSLGNALDVNDKLSLTIKPFDLIVKRYADCMCFCVIAPNDVEESIYRIKCIEQGKVVRDEIPDSAVGRVSKGNRYEFDLMICRPSQSFRIETVPSVDVVMGKSEIIYQQDEREDA